MPKNDGVATAGCAVIFVWIISALLSLGLPFVVIGVIWGIIELVLHFTR